MTIRSAFQHSASRNSAVGTSSALISVRIRSAETRERVTLRRDWSCSTASAIARVLVQIGRVAEMLRIGMDTLLIEQDGIPDGVRTSILEPESGEVELALANAMQQRDSRNRGRGTPEAFES